MNKEFESFNLTVEGLNNLDRISAQFDHLLETLAVLCPTGREFSIAKTKLEEACFFAKKSAASSPTNRM